MEISDKEVSVVQAVAQQPEKYSEELSNLQLALVGGGVGDVVLV